jgi:transposase-like protein
MEESRLYIKWLKDVIKSCDNKDLQREHWAFSRALEKYKQLTRTLPECPTCQSHNIRIKPQTHGYQCRECRTTFDQ